MSEPDTREAVPDEEPDADAGEPDGDDAVELEDLVPDDDDDTVELEDLVPDDAADGADEADEADDAADVDADEPDDDTAGLEDFVPDEEPDADAGEVDEADDAANGVADDVTDAGVDSGEPGEPIEPAEPIETEVVATVPDGMVRERPDTLRQFAAEAGPLTFRLIPEFANSGFRWVLTMYADGVRGSIIETSQGIPADLAAEYGLAETMRQEVNSKLEYANENLEPPRMMRGQERETKRISELGSDEV